MPSFVPCVKYSIMQRNIPTTLSVCSKQHHVSGSNWVNGHSFPLTKQVWSPRLRSYGYCASALHRTSEHSLTTSGSNIVTYIRHNVLTETPIAITHNHPLPMLSTTLPAPLISPLVATLLPARSQTTTSCSIDTAAPPPCSHALLSLLLHQVPHVCVNTVSFFDRLTSLRQWHACVLPMEATPPHSVCPGCIVYALLHLNTFLQWWHDIQDTLKPTPSLQ